MPNNPDRPFDHDTVALRAVFVPDSARDNVSRDSITSAVGFDAVEIPAVFVPDGATPPGYPYEAIGRPIFRPDEPGAAQRKFTSWQSSSRPSDPAQGDGEPARTLPRTRYRFGAALSGGRNPGPPPNPTLPTRQNDPLRTAAGILRGIRAATATLARQRAKSSSKAAATTAPVDPPGLPPDTSRQED